MLCIDLKAFADHKQNYKQGEHVSCGEEMIYSSRHTGSLSWFFSKLTFHRQQHLPLLQALSLKIPRAGWIGFQDPLLSWD